MLKYELVFFFIRSEENINLVTWFVAENYFEIEYFMFDIQLKLFFPPACSVYLRPNNDRVVTDLLRQ